MKESVQFVDISSPESVAGDVARLFHEWDSYRSKQLDLWAEIDNYIHATENGTFDNNFDHKTFIPVIAEIHEDLQAIIYATMFPHDDWLGWKPFDREASTVDKRKNVLGFIKHIHALNGFKEVFRQLIDDFVRYGNCFAQVVHVNEQQVNADGTVTEGYVGPRVKRFSPYDVVFNPTAASFAQAPVCVKELKSIGSFLTWVKEMEDAGMPVNPEAVQKVKDVRSSASYSSQSATKKNSQFSKSGFNSIEAYYASGYVECIWFYGDVYDNKTQTVHKNRTIVIVDQNTVIFNMEKAAPDIFKGTWKARPDNLWGQGALDNVVGMNFMINHRENAKNDAIDRMIYPDRLYVGEVDEIFDENTNQIKYISPEGGSVQDIPIDSSVLSFNTEIDLHEQRARRASRLPQQLSGFRTPGEKTAFEVQSLNDGAFRGFISKAEQLEEAVLEKVVQAEIASARNNLTAVINIAAENEDKLFEFLEVSNADLRSNGKLIPYGSRRFSRMLQQQAGFTQLASSPLLQVVAPHLSAWNLAEAITSVYGFDDFGVFEKFAAVSEQLEQQQVTNMAQQELQAGTNQRTVEELTPEDMNVQDSESSNEGV